MIFDKFALKLSIIFAIGIFTFFIPAMIGSFNEEVGTNTRIWFWMVGCTIVAGILGYSYRFSEETDLQNNSSVSQEPKS